MATAAPFASELRNAPKWTPVESQRAIAVRLDVSGTIVSEARRLLADHGVIAKHEGMYYVA